MTKIKLVKLSRNISCFVLGLSFPQCILYLFTGFSVGSVWFHLIIVLLSIKMILVTAADLRQIQAEKFSGH